jgi:hypothetical protein
MVPAVSSSMALLKVTVAAVAVASSAISWVAMTSRAVVVATATRQAAVPAVLTLVLHPRIPISRLVRHPRAMALIREVLTRVLRRRAMARNTVPHRRKTMARNMVPHRRASALNLDLTTRQVVTSDSSRMAASNQVVSGVSSKQVLTVVRHLSTAATAKEVTRAVTKAVPVATSSLRADIHKADMAVRLLLRAGMAAVDTSSRMATAVMDGDLVSHGLDIDTRA